MVLKRLLIGASIVALVFAVAGCSAVEDKIAEEVSEEIAGGLVGGDVEIDDDSVTMDTGDGEVTIEGGGDDLPSDFPSDFPMYGDADLDSTSKVADPNGTVFYVNLVSGDDAIDVYEWYKGEFEDEGWTIVGDMSMTDDSGTTAIVSANKDDMEGSVTVGTTDSGSEIGVILNVK
jgi:hypothetical protein